MLCPNCKEAHVYNNTCPACGLDAVLFGRTSIMSCKLYNKGLAQVKMKDLSGAIVSLSRSIEFNKNNILSRNLLGLIYFEIGYIGEALKQWIISRSLIPEDNMAAGYIARLGENARALEKMSDSVANYNNALEYVQQQNDERAIIQLKKALELNPGFIDALNLLAFCYLINKDRERAKVLVERVLALDVNNPTAINYYTALNPNKLRPEPKKLTKTQAMQGEAAPGIAPRRENHYVTEVLCFLIGLVAASALMFFLVLPGHVAAANREISALRQSLEVAETIEEQFEQSQARADQLEERLEALQTENSILSVQADNTVRFHALLQARAYMENSQPIHAANILLAMEFEGLPPELYANAVELRDMAFPEAARLTFLEAETQFGSGNYTNAQSLLDASISFGADSLAFYDQVLFYLGYIAELNGQLETARAYFQMVFQQFPNSNRRQAAAQHISGIEQRLS